MNSDLKLIKKKYGEKMSHLCRELFPIILEQEGLLPKLLLDHFEPNHLLYEDIVKDNAVNSFKNYIYRIIDNNQEETQEIVTKTPKELLSEAGYDLYECHSEEDIQNFKKYYAKNEQLCTFKGGRLNGWYVFFAVKKNVDQIRRKNFDHPRRQDEYGTSVISIQFQRDVTHMLSIKNRYNHRVKNPDATFSNNLDNIISGLTDSFSKYYGLEQKNYNKNNFEITGYVKANDGKFYPYNVEINNVYYCPNNIIIDNYEVKKYDKDKYLLFDYFLLNVETKEFVVEYQSDGFFGLCSNIERIEIEKQGFNKIVKIYDRKSGLTELKLNKRNQIISLKNEEKRMIGIDFLSYCEEVEEIELPNATYIGARFMRNNNQLKKIYLSNVELIRDGFLEMNFSVEEVILPNVQTIGNSFLENNEIVNSILIPKVKIIGDSFLQQNKNLHAIDLPVTEKIGDDFLDSNDVISLISLPRTKKIGDGFMTCNHQIKKVYFPLVEEIGSYFLNFNEVVEEVILPRVQYLGPQFLEYNKKLRRFVIPKELENEIWNKLNPDPDYIFAYRDGAPNIENTLRRLLIRKRS